jgi:hypothetical protein
VLNVGKLTGGPNAGQYYLDQIARGRDEYDHGEGQTPGPWVGASAGLLGLCGEVDGDDFLRLLGGAGRRNARANGVAGFDLTFRAPKSVSVLWAIASPAIGQQLRAGHDAAVEEALAYLERQACRGRRGTDGTVQVQGDGFVGAAFVHRSSRAGDPLLHAHVVVGNLVRGPDGRWTALDARHLYRQQKTAGCLTLETRRAKQDVPLDRLRLDWTSRAAEHGLTAGTVERLLGRSDARAAEVSPGVLEELTRRRSTFGRPELLAALAANQPAGGRVAELDALANHILAGPAVVALPRAAARPA